MSPFAYYLLGLLTPFGVLFVAMIGWAFQEQCEARRYKRAWDLFSGEFDRLTPGQLRDLQAVWRDNEYRYGNCVDDRSRYFRMCWNGGNTTRV